MYIYLLVGKKQILSLQTEIIIVFIKKGRSRETSVFFADIEKSGICFFVKTSDIRDFIGSLLINIIVEPV